MTHSNMGKIFENIRGEIIEDARHVTARRLVPLIARQGFVPDRAKPGVLGTGVYFDIGSTESGIEPARQKYPDEELVVFYAKIYARNVLDIDDAATAAGFVDFQQTLNRDLGKQATLDMGRGGQIDAFIERLKMEEGVVYHTVSKTFVRDKVTRIAVREPHRIIVVELTDLKGVELEWQPKSN